MGKQKLSAKDRSRFRYQKERNAKAVKELLVIDNTPLRNHEIKLAKGSFRKIDQLEKAILNFQEKDQKLFDEWHALTFRSLKMQVDDRRQEFMKLANFHNQMVYLIEEYNYSDLEAFKVLFDEEQQYEFGDDKIRQQIDEKRAKRNEDLEKLMRGEFDDRFDHLDEDNGFDQDDDENGRKQGAPTFDRDELDRILFLSPDAIKKKFRSFESGFEFLSEVIPILVEANQPRKLREIWDLAPANFKREFNKAGKKGMGISFDSFLEDIESLHEETKEDPLNEDSEDSFSFEYVGAGHHKSEKLSENELLEITAIYRKIVRKIHPDQIDTEILRKRKSWFDEIWKRSLLAKERGLLKEMKQIYAKILASFQEYESLSLFELSSVAKSLNQELDHLKHQAKSLRTHPAWKFSENKNLKRLEEKLSRPFLNQLAKFNEDIEEMLAIRNMLKSWAEMGTRKAKGPKKRRAKQRSNKHKDKKDQRQMSFGSMS